MLEKKRAEEFGRLLQYPKIFGSVMVWSIFFKFYNARNKELIKHMKIKCSDRRNDIFQREKSRINCL